MSDGEPVNSVNVYRRYGTVPFHRRVRYRRTGWLSGRVRRAARTRSRARYPRERHALGAVFAGKNVLTIRERAVPSFAAGVMATVLDLWLIVAPLQYESVGPALTAVTQFGGMCLAAFSAYTALVAVEGFFSASEADHWGASG